MGNVSAPHPLFTIRIRVRRMSGTSAKENIVVLLEKELPWHRDHASAEWVIELLTSKV